MQLPYVSAPSRVTLVSLFLLFAFALSATARGNRGVPPPSPHPAPRPVRCVEVPLECQVATHAAESGRIAV